MTSLSHRFEGRSSRADFWAAFVNTSLVILVLATILLFVSLETGVGQSILGYGDVHVVEGPDDLSDTSATIIALLAAGCGLGLLLSLTLFVLVFYPACIRRRHDRGGNGWDVRGFIFVLTATIAISIHPDSEAIVADLFLVIKAWCLYLAFVLGVLPGNENGDRYQEDFGLSASQSMLIPS